jgi:phosphoribosylamine--glycine ligase
MGVTAIAPHLKEARAKAYEAINDCDFEGSYYRHDIGAIYE